MYFTLDLKHLNFPPVYLLEVIRAAGTNLQLNVRKTEGVNGRPNKHNTGLNPATSKAQQLDIVPFQRLPTRHPRPQHVRGYTGRHVNEHIRCMHLDIDIVLMINVLTLVCHHL